MLFRSTIYPQKLVNIRVENSMKDKAMEVPAIAAIIEKMEAEMAGNGRILVRPSGTEPLLRVMAEAHGIDHLFRIKERTVPIGQNSSLWSLGSTVQN